MPHTSALYGRIEWEASEGSYPYVGGTFPMFYVRVFLFDIPRDGAGGRQTILTVRSRGEVSDTIARRGGGERVQMLKFDRLGGSAYGEQFRFHLWGSLSLTVTTGKEVYEASYRIDGVKKRPICNRHRRMKFTLEDRLREFDPFKIGLLPVSAASGTPGAPLPPGSLFSLPLEDLQAGAASSPREKGWDP